MLVFGYRSGSSFRMLGFRLLDSVWFLGSDRCRLLIQRWKREGGIGNFFDQGYDLPDESEICPTKGKGGGGIAGIRLKDIEPGGDLVAVALSDRYLIAKKIDRIAADIVDFGDIDDIGAMDFEEVGSYELFFHILERAVCDIVLSGRDEFDIVAHAFEEEDVVFFKLDEFVLGLNE